MLCTCRFFDVITVILVSQVTISASFSAPRPNSAAEAARLLERAKEIRESIPKTAESQATKDLAPSSDLSSAANGAAKDALDMSSVGYRLYVDIGREDGTWMDPRWGASGRRIEFTCDVTFEIPFCDENSGQDLSLANQDTVGKMVGDNFGGKSSPVRILKSSERARLRGGFDSMKCQSGGYRIDVGGGNGNAVVRFFLDVAGTPITGSSFGDISVPKGPLYFSLPVFGNNVSNLSSRDGPVTVRQIGWHTGWRRQESRIVGTFRAKPIEEARIRDKY